MLSQQLITHVLRPSHTLRGKPTGVVVNWRQINVVLNGRRQVGRFKVKGWGLNTRTPEWFYVARNYVTRDDNGLDSS